MCHLAAARKSAQKDNCYSMEGGGSAQKIDTLRGRKKHTGDSQQAHFCCQSQQNVRL